MGRGIILKYTVKKKEEGVWSGFIWLRAGTSGDIFVNMSLNFQLYKERRVS
jgi:hypothetical protein